MHLANSTANPDTFKSTLQSGKNKSATYLIMCGRVKPNIFESDDVANSCPVSYRTINLNGDTTTIRQICCHYCTLYGACSEHILLLKSPGYYSESGYHWMLVDMRIRFEYAMCGREIFKSRKRKLQIQKYLDTCGWDLNLLTEY